MASERTRAPVPRDPADDYTPEAAARRRDFLRERTGATLERVSRFSEGTLVAGSNRGVKLLHAAGGVRTTVLDDRMQRAPAFVFPGRADDALGRNRP